MRKFAGSDGVKELEFGLPDQAVAYPDEEVEKGSVGGGGDGWDSEGELTSGEGLPRIAERMEYSRLAASDPKGKDGASRGASNRGSVGVKAFMTVNQVVSQGMIASGVELRIPDEAFGVAGA